VIDSDDYIYAYRTDGTKLGAWKAYDIARLRFVAAGIAYYNNDLWIVDSGTDKIYWYDEAGGRTSGSYTANKVFSLPSSIGDAKGITTDGTHLWVVNDGSGTGNAVSRYTITTGLDGKPCWGAW